MLSLRVQFLLTCNLFIADLQKQNFHQHLSASRVDSLAFIKNLKPTARDIYGSKRNLTGYNVYLRYFLKHFELLTDKERKVLLCDLQIHSADMYSLSDEDSVISTPRTSTIDVIKAASIKWKKMEKMEKKCEECVEVACFRDKYSTNSLIL